MEKKYIGQLKYHLHKDNSLVCDLFETIEEMRENIKKLKKYKYNYLINLFKEPLILNFK